MRAASGRPARVGAGRTDQESRSAGHEPHLAWPCDHDLRSDHVRRFHPGDQRPRRSHAADTHDLIRVVGARVNNLKDISVEIPKRRLTVFTGISGSGKSSLVFGTIAAESQRLINETYSAFVQGFMPTLARPDVDVLDGITTAISVDQERMGSNPRSTVGTATDADAMLRILFSRLGKPHIGGPGAYSFNVASVHGSGGLTVERGDKTITKSASFSRTGGMCQRCEGRGSVSDFDLSALYDDTKSLNDGALTIPGYSMEGWYGRIFRGCGYFDMDKPIKKFNKRELHDLLYKEPTKIKVEGINLTYAGLIPSDPEVDARPRTSRRCSRTSARSWSGRWCSPPAPTAMAPGSARQPGRRRSPAPTSPTSPQCRSPTSRSGWRAWTSRPSPRSSSRCGTRSTRSSRSGWATSRSTGPRARCRAARRSAPG